MLITAKTTGAAMGLFSLCLLMSACGRPATRNAALLTEDEKHRLYAAALASSDSPVDSKVFERVCRQLEIFDANGKPNDSYLRFVSAHVDWATKQQTEQFRNEIKIPENARRYISQRLGE